MCDLIKEFTEYELHHLNVVSQVKTEDMKSENKYYG